MIQPAPRSNFVTVLAWIFIVLAGFATLVSIMQNIMVWLIFPVAEMRGAAAKVEGQPGVPWFATLMFDYFQWFFLAFLAVCAATLAASIGLLKRKNWARISFIALMVLGILWNIAGVVMMYFFVSSFTEMPMPRKQPAAEHFGMMMNVMMGFNALITIAFTALWAWIIKRLVSADIRREFTPA